MSNVMNFNFNGKEFRTVNQNGEIYFCLADVCNVLELDNVSQAKSRLKKDGVISNDVIDSLGRTQQATFINEANFYKTVLQSRKPQAEPFTDWVTSEVLPSIRKHGMYATSQTVEKMLSDPDTAIRLLQNIKEERQKRIEAETINKENRPKVLFADAIVAADNSILIGKLANVLKQNGIDIGQNRLFRWLREKGYLCKNGDRYNQPTQRSMELELFEVSYNTIVRSDKSIQTITTKVTGKGQMYFINKFISKAIA